jgi:hypothetical protein
MIADTVAGTAQQAEFGVDGLQVANVTTVLSGWQPLSTRTDQVDRKPSATPFMQ